MVGCGGRRWVVVGDVGGVWWVMRWAEEGVRVSMGWQWRVGAEDAPPPAQPQRRCALLMGTLCTNTAARVQTVQTMYKPSYKLSQKRVQTVQTVKVLKTI